REGDYVFRTGGDEFLMVLPKTTEKETEKIYNMIKDFCKKNRDAKIVPSIALGLAVKLEGMKDIQIVFKEAEDQMYKNKVFESESVNNTIIKSLETMLRETTNETLEHSLRVEKYSIDIGNEINLSEWQLNTLASLAHLHDIGKVTIPVSILEKAGPLNPEEWEIIKRHPEIGYKIANSSPKLTRIADGILAHHEWWNGMGYPKGLKGDEIPILARIITVVDAFDVMTSGRTYQEPMSIKLAVEELISCSGSQFDPEIVKIFINQLDY
ncbi:MAG: HD-GYP domain-containing protein, partial [Candidatus Izimaplasma sp.]|nr:HD-GYP domain-containing protein [Candidatus Izimaplasma bacterium]